MTKEQIDAAKELKSRLEKQRSIGYFNLSIAVDEGLAVCNAVLGEPEPTPIYKHDCPRCVFLGRYETSARPFDLWFCNLITVPTVIARYGSGSMYTSGLGTGMPHLIEAERRARERGLLKPLLPPDPPAATEEPQPAAKPFVTKTGLYEQRDGRTATVWYIDWSDAYGAKGKDADGFYKSWMPDGCVISNRERHHLDLVEYLGPLEEPPPGRVEMYLADPERDSLPGPSHYTAFSIQPIDVIESWSLSFALGNVLKYIARADLKGSATEDLEKARWYIEREITNRKRGGK
jgi:hypothetical protein